MSSLYSNDGNNIQWDKFPTDATHYLPDDEENYETICRLNDVDLEYDFIFATELADNPDTTWAQFPRQRDVDCIKTERKLVAK